MDDNPWLDDEEEEAAADPNPPPQVNPAPAAVQPVVQPAVQPAQPAVLPAQAVQAANAPLQGQPNVGAAPADGQAQGATLGRATLVPSQRGKPKVERDGFLYNQKKRLRDGTISLECERNGTKQDGCGARAYMDDNHMIVRYGETEHNHASRPEKAGQLQV